jgi:hypothetical protein
VGQLEKKLEETEESLRELERRSRQLEGELLVVCMEREELRVEVKGLLALVQRLGEGK